MKSLVTDKNGVEIKPGQTVLVHQDEGTREAVVVKPFPDSPTVNAPGHWVDINDGRGAEGMMSYILEVKQLVMVLLLVLFAVPCFAQETLQQYQDNSLRGGYERFGSPTARWSTNPPKLYSSSGTYLGELSQNRYNPDSISNPFGVYGSRYSPTSINNPYSPYGAYSTRPIWIYQSPR